MLFYVDPPYLPETREPGSKGRVRAGRYRHEMDADDHRRLLDVLVGCTGMVVLSGYPSAMYAQALRGWRRVEKNTFADAARPRVECLWLNPAAEAAVLSRDYAA